MGAVKVVGLIVLVLVISTGSTSAECNYGIDFCSFVFNMTVFDPLLIEHDVCSGLQTFLGCVFLHGCGITSMEEKLIVTSVISKLHQYSATCSLTAFDLVKKYKNGASNHTPLTSSLMLLALVSASIKLCCL